MTQKIAYLDCFSGISGDMFLGALLDAGLPFTTLKEALAALPVQGYQLTLEKYEDKGIRGSRLKVDMTEEAQPTRHLSDIVALLEASTLPASVREKAQAIFRCLAQAEATVHDTSIDEVHFHEVGAVDAIVDITGAAIGIEALGIEQLYASALPLTSGYVQAAHGVLPVPAPATLEILRRVKAPWKPCPAEGELVTPTGAAILAALARFETPRLTIESVGYGYGQKRLAWPNCLRLCLGQSLEASATTSGQAETDWVTVIETHIDNMSGELLGPLMDRLMAAGALDASYTPIQMKKNRPATLVTLICTPEDGERLAMLLLSETSTLGVRIQEKKRLKARRAMHQLETPLGTLAVKVKLLGERVIGAVPEYEDCLHIAKERDLPLVDVYELALRTAKELIIESR
ncbi:nickel pincer cofactor biosynthesis protein LarC [Ktedonosporobacter rubrisoli]|uniref:Putative nickel insertion protein n=1 Tax=Ktedonosporobacter rubrisoli TaxID=2509675 RepID=A0A4P6K2E0_KTERU|nr:nickel pincer cofactor biosynthesis protein LarC [Ktedonosporobacter rubrisoli]QBD82304.1 nickel pincer cofactor biosynthesis protein LarC [Ktedonosporobacter rubrisoli]